LSCQPARWGRGDRRARGESELFNNSREDIVFSLFEWIRVVIASQRIFGS